MDPSNETWPPPPSIPVEPGEWDDFINAELAEIPVDAPLRRGRVMRALRQKAGVGAGASSRIVLDYYQRHGIVDVRPPMKFTPAFLGYLIYFLAVCGVAGYNVALCAANPTTRIERLRIDGLHVDLAMAQLLLTLPLILRAFLVSRRQRSNRTNIRCRSI